MLRFVKYLGVFILTVGVIFKSLSFPYATNILVLGIGLYVVSIGTKLLKSPNKIIDSKNEGKGFLVFGFVEIIVFCGIYYLQAINSAKLCPSDGPTMSNYWKQVDVDLNELTTEILQFDSVVAINQHYIYYEKDTFRTFAINKQGLHSMHKMLIFSGVHGNEPASTLVIPEFLNRLVKDSTFYEKWNITIAGPINPVGLKYSSRYNEFGCDCNRDFNDFTTSQGKLQKQLIDSIQPDIIISLHEGDYDGYTIIANQHIPEELGVFLSKELQKQKIPLATKVNTIELEIDGFFKFPYHQRLLAKLSGMKTIDFYGDDKGLKVLTLESNATDSNIKNRINSHLKCIEGVVKYYDKTLPIQIDR